MPLHNSKILELFQNQPVQELPQASAWIDPCGGDAHAWRGPHELFSILVSWHPQSNEDNLENPERYEKTFLKKPSLVEEAINEELFNRNNHYNQQWDQILATQYAQLDGVEAGVVLDRLIAATKQKLRRRCLVDCLYQHTYYYLLEQDPALDDLAEAELNQRLTRQLKDPAYRQKLVTTLTQERREAVYRRHYQNQLPPALADILEQHIYTGATVHILGRHTPSGIEYVSITEHSNYVDNYSRWRSRFNELNQTAAIPSLVLYFNKQEELFVYETPTLIFLDLANFRPHLRGKLKDSGGVQTIKTARDIAYEYFLSRKQLWPED